MATLFFKQIIAFASQVKKLCIQAKRIMSINKQWRKKVIVKSGL